MPKAAMETHPSESQLHGLSCYNQNVFSKGK